MKLLAVLFSCFFLYGYSARPEAYVSVHLEGQLGNQLFQIATAYAYSLDHNLPLTVPELKSSLKYDIPHNDQVLFSRNISSYSPRFPPTLIWKEPNFNYSVIPDARRIELRGWFQSEKYFAHRRKEILELFAAPKGLTEQILNKYPFLTSDAFVVGVQIRDYRSYTPTGEYHPTMDRRYYEKAFAYFPKDAIYLVSSNNGEFARECTQGLARNIIYLNADYIEEFYTLVLCKSFVISNSSFGWWAAWLSTVKNKKVIAPNPWFSLPYDNASMMKDLIPQNYTVISGR